MYMLDTEDDRMDGVGLASWVVAEDARLADLWSESVWDVKESRDLGLPPEAFAYRELESGEDWEGRDTERNADCEELTRNGGMEPWGMLVGESSKFRIPLKLLGRGGRPDKDELIVRS